MEHKANNMHTKTNTNTFGESKASLGWKIKLRHKSFHCLLFWMYLGNLFLTAHHFHFAWLAVFFLCFVRARIFETNVFFFQIVYEFFQTKERENPILFMFWTDKSLVYCHCHWTELRNMGKGLKKDSNYILSVVVFLVASLVNKFRKIEKKTLQNKVKVDNFSLHSPLFSPGHIWFSNYYRIAHWNSSYYFTISQ